MQPNTVKVATDPPHHTQTRSKDPLGRVEWLQLNVRLWRRI